MFRYVVLQGDNLSRLARTNSLSSWRDIYFHDANRGFRLRRSNPNMIFPGDVVNIPEPDEVTTPIPRGGAQTRSRPAHQPLTPQASQTNVRPRTPSVANTSRETLPPDPADEADLAEQSLLDAQRRVSNDASLANWRTDIVRILKSLSNGGAQRVYRGGTEGFLFGNAIISRSRITSGHKRPELHRGTRLFRGLSIITRTEPAVILFLPEFDGRENDYSIMRLRPTSTMIFGGRGNGNRRRITTPARFENGRLREILLQVRGGETN